MNVEPIKKPRDVKIAEDFIRSILPYQAADGGFRFYRVANLRAKLGPHFMNAVSTLAARLGGLDVAMMAAIAALLEEQFQICRILRVLMAPKARDYIGARNPKYAELVREAKGLIPSIPSVLDEAKPSVAAKDASVELERAPIFADT